MQKEGREVRRKGRRDMWQKRPDTEGQKVRKGRYKEGRKEGKIYRRKETTDTKGEIVGVRNRKRDTWKPRTGRKNEE
jgi:hypothetical protein